MNEQLVFTPDPSPEFSPAHHLARILCNKHLSWKAKGVLVFMIGIPRHGSRVFRTTDFLTFSLESEDEVRAAFLELQKEGYAMLKRKASGAWVWVFSDTNNSTVPRSTNLTATIQNN